MNLLIRDVISRESNVKVTNAIELNSSWISFTVNIFKGTGWDLKRYKITFKDSFKIFGSSLMETTKSFCKKAFKTHLDHNIINRMYKDMVEQNKNSIIQ